MKSYLFTTENGRGGVMLCDIDTLEEAVPYLRKRFDRVVRVEQGLELWTIEGGFGEFHPRPVEEVLVEVAEKEG
ncbi:hypothetical protein GCM10011352_21710 [Marinobacterium zhoushanense]|uniref:Uncharacterized protein n=1 Tax=Marinobacterium zhoushanense TaxID=1679163 RepID=A0ABQ1KGB1_9GAMM|nr:hypothetical protein [Marinobacterium zhoushanense]GGB95285.1 hypothetical protein GCM10011352_21710 [Marinobacterium zhoushanense]